MTAVDIVRLCSSTDCWFLFVINYNYETWYYNNDSDGINMDANETACKLQTHHYETFNHEID